MELTKDQLKNELDALETKILAASVKYQDDSFFKCKKVSIVVDNSLVKDKMLIIDGEGGKEAQIPIDMIKDVEKFDDDEDVIQYIITTTDDQKIIISVAA